MQNTLEKLRKFLTSYVYFTDPNTALPVSYWIAATYFYEVFDVFPYAIITAHTKRAGKTRLSELIGFTCQHPFSVTGASAASMMRTIAENKPTIIWDEAETLSSESSSLVRAFLNVGYRKGQTIMRATGKGVIEFPTYCPKVFVLIGSTYDTLKDRSIFFRMQRTDKELKRFMYEIAKAEGKEIGEELKYLLVSHLAQIQEAYAEINISFLTDRDEEIWRPLFAICKVLDPANYNLLCRIAVDMATEKTAPEKKYGNVDLEAEARAVKEEYATKALNDLASILPKDIKGISSLDAVEKMKEIDTAPWRKYLGVGLNQDSLADLLSVFQVRTHSIRKEGAKQFKGSGQGVYRGYKREHILAAIKLAKGE